MIRINLLPSAQRRPKKADLTIPIIIGVAAFVLLGGIAFYGWQTYQIKKAEEQKILLQSALDDYSRQKAKLDEIKRNLSELEKRLQVKDTIMKDAIDVPLLIAELGAFIPKDVQIRSAGMQKGSLQLEIATTSYFSAANLLQSLEAAPSFEEVETTSVSKSDKGVSFSVRCNLVEVGGTTDGTSSY
jgi:Tfp pilus assembly protein PilN